MGTMQRWPLIVVLTSGGAAGAAATTGGQASTPSAGAGGTNAGVIEGSAADDGGCTCELPRSKSRTLPFALFAMAVGVAWSRARARRNAS
jgi:hypothetical protein